MGGMTWGDRWGWPVEVLRILSRAAEQGHCSWASAEAVARHVELHGKPWAVVDEGLDAARSVGLKDNLGGDGGHGASGVLHKAQARKHSWVIQRGPRIPLFGGEGRWAPRTWAFGAVVEICNGRLETTAQHGGKA